MAEIDSMMKWSLASSTSASSTQSLSKVFEQSLCDKCRQEVSLVRTLCFLESENALLTDQVQQLERLCHSYKKEVEKLKEDNKGSL